MNDSTAPIRLLLVDDPMGGRPVTEIPLNSAGANQVADVVAPNKVTITAEPEMPPNSVEAAMLTCPSPPRK